jgi:(2S)-methylsuccinyl-CoA dehydrogenase
MVQDGAVDADVELYLRTWTAARDAAAAATAEWAAAAQDPFAEAIARGAAADRSAEGFDAAFGEVAGLMPDGGHAENIGLSDEHRMFRATLRDFAERRLSSRAGEIHRGDLDVPDDVIHGVAELGLFGLSIPEQYGGSLGARPDHVAMLIGTEELSTASLAAGGSLMTRPEILVRALLTAGTEEQKRRWLPGIASGDLLVAVAVTEPDTGSDVSAIRCRASRQDDGGWSITGAKLWCTFAGKAHLLMILCRTGGGDSGHRGLSLFVAEKPSFAGHEFEVRQEHGGALHGRAIRTLGYRGLHTFELVLEDYRLPAAALVGDEGRGFYLQMEGFSTGRLQTAARAVGVMQAAVRDAFAYTRSRVVFGRPIAEHGLARAMLGRMAVRLHASRQLSYWAGRRLDDGHPDAQVQASLAKLYASRMAEYVTRDATQLFGAMGYGEETDVSRYFVDARVLAIFEGAEEVLALRVIGRSLERGPRSPETV